MNMAGNLERERLEKVLQGQQALMAEVHLLIAEEEKHDAILRATVLGSKGKRVARIRDLDPERVYHLDTIRSCCIKYRLRFLDGGLFKGDIPLQAIHAIRQLERRSDGPLLGFKVMAPASRFRLCDSEVDPLLFVPIGDDRYYLVHKWGSDLHPMRVLAGWPVRSAVHLGITVLLVAVLLSALIPTFLLTTDPTASYWGVHRFLFLFWSAMVCASFTVFGWFAFFGQFSAEAWNSRHFN